MKRPLALLCAFLSVSSLPAAVPVSGTGSYSQNFDTLPASGSAGWSQGITLPSWYVHRSTLGVPSSIAVTNGSGSWSQGLYSMGISGGADRALGSAPTTSHGVYSTAVIFQNTGSTLIRLTRVRYRTEIYRTNQSLSTAESILFSWKTAAQQSTLVNELNTTGQLSGWTADAGLSSPSITFNGAGMPGSSGQVNPPVAIAKDAAPALDILVPAGQFVALRWLDSNEANSDAYLALDDVVVDWASVSCAITTQITNNTRNENGTALESDDTWAFQLAINGIGTGTRGWTIPALGLSGNYGTTIPVQPSLSQSPLNITIQDVEDPDCTAQISVAIPCSALSE